MSAEAAVMSASSRGAISFVAVVARVLVALLAHTRSSAALLHDGYRSEQQTSQPLPELASGM